MSVRSSEQGSMSAFVAILAVFFVALALLVADGGRRLANISRAEDLASEAARAAAATLDVGALARGEALVDQAGDDGAQAEAARLLRLAGDEVEFRVVVAEDRRSVRVDVVVHGTAVVPGFDIRGHGTHTARVIEPPALLP